MFNLDINPNVILGIAFAFLVLGIINVLKPEMPFFALKGQPKRTRTKGIIRVVMAICILIAYYIKYRN